MVQDNLRAATQLKLIMWQNHFHLLQHEYHCRATTTSAPSALPHVGLSGVTPSDQGLQTIFLLLEKAVPKKCIAEFLE